MGMGMGTGGVGTGMEMGIGTGGMATWMEMLAGGMGMETWTGTGGMGTGMEPEGRGMGLGTAECHLCCRFLRGRPVGTAVLPEELVSAVVVDPVPGAIRYVLHTKVWGGERGPDPTAPCCPLTHLLSPQPGPGPQLLDDPSQHLLGPDGLPCRSA